VMNDQFNDGHVSSVFRRSISNTAAFHRTTPKDNSSKTLLKFGVLQNKNILLTALPIQHFQFLRNTVSAELCLNINDGEDKVFFISSILIYIKKATFYTEYRLDSRLLEG
jgi:hypothetical protein